MKKFELSADLNSNKIFILSHSELGKRFDPFYYIPGIKKLEEKVRKNEVKPLRNYVISISSGATPKTAEKEKFYSDSDNGIPFLRVQNLLPTGELDYSECKFINKKTHENYLRRSQVSEGDLLVKITGVGRMAVASVAPDGFIGNTNQHMVVIKTRNKEVSKVLASYLNSDIGEKLASRRATGGTRPALDYPALLSIPIVYDKRILEINQDAIARKDEKLLEAKSLLSSIDNYLLSELGIELPKINNSLNERIYTVKFNDISNERIDPFFNNPNYIKFSENLENYSRLSELIISITKGETPLWRGDDYVKEGVPFLQVNNLSNKGIDSNFKLIPIEVHNRMHRSKLFGGEVLYSMAGTIGITVLNNLKAEANINQAIAKIIVDEEKVNKIYLIEYLNSKLGRIQAKRYLTVSSQPNINFGQIKGIRVVLPSEDKQIQIVKHISKIRQAASQLEQDANEVMENAKTEVERLILGQ